MSFVPNKQVVAMSAAGAITVSAVETFVEITASAAVALTLAAPVCDGQRVFVQDAAGHAHTVTTPSNGINGNKTTATFGGTLAQYVMFLSYNGNWMVMNQSGITLS